MNQESRFWECCTVRERSERLFSLSERTDCVFLVGPDQARVAAHRLLLAMSSPVFDIMFFGPLAQSEEPILIPDVQPDAFRTLLTYLYTDNLSVNTFEETLDVIYVAEKYMMTDCVKKCFEHLLKKVTTGNVCQLLEFTTMFEDNALVEKCNEILSRQTSKVLEQKGFLEAHPSTLVKIFSLDRLNIQKESDLLVAVQKYIQARGLKRSMASGEPEAKRVRYGEIILIAAAVCVAAARPQAEHGHGHHATSSQSIVLHQTHHEPQHNTQSEHKKQSGHHEHHEEHHGHPKYEFAYHVEDKHTGDIKSQHETRDGKTVVIL